MKRRSLLVLAVLGLLVGGPTPLAAQEGEVCPAIVEAALDAAGEVCTGLGRNTACYGHDRVDAVLRAEEGELAFAAPADRVPLAALQTLRTAALDEATQEWGVAVLHLQANLPDTLPGQAVILLLMGDASLGAATASAATGTPQAPTATPAAETPAPMQAITFHSGLGGATCQEAAGSLLVQSPEGIEVALTINGLDVQMGSTALFSTVPTEEGGEALVASLVEGHLRLLSADRILTLADSGAAVAITLNALGRVDTASRLLDPRPLLEAAGRALPGADACRAIAPLLRENFDPAVCGIGLRFDLLEGALNDGWQLGDLLSGATDGGLPGTGDLGGGLLPDNLQPGNLLPDGGLPNAPSLPSLPGGF